MMSEEVNYLICAPWDVPECQPPTSRVMVNISAVVARAVLKKASSIRIPRNVSKPQSIDVDPKNFESYEAFSAFIHTATRVIEKDQNVIFFADYQDESKFIYDITCLWAIISQVDEISILAVSLNTDLTSRIIKWDIVSEVVINDLSPRQQQPPNSVSIASIQSMSQNERRHQSISIFDEDSEMNFSGPICLREKEEIIMKISVWKKYAPILLSLNSIMYTIDTHFKRIGRTHEINEDIVSEICLKILDEHTVDLSD